MTLYFLIVVSGIVLSAALIAILTALTLFAHPRRVLCLKSRQDAECTTRCIRSCHLATLATSATGR